MLITPDTAGKLKVVISEKVFIKRFKECVRDDVYFKDHFTDAGLREVFKMLVRTAPRIDWDNLGELCNYIQEAKIRDYIEEYEVDINDIVYQDHYVASTGFTVLYFAGFGG